jgi:hypothetical protein
MLIAEVIALSWHQRLTGSLCRLKGRAAVSMVGRRG